MTADAVLVVLSVVATVITVAWMVLNRRHPENASTHEPNDVRVAQELPMDRPADAGAESQVAEPSGRLEHRHGAVH